MCLYKNYFHKMKAAFSNFYFAGCFLFLIKYLFYHAQKGKHKNQGL